MAIIIPVIIGAAAASSAVTAGLVVAGGVGAALISTGASLLTGALMDAAGINMGAAKKAEKKQQEDWEKREKARLNLLYQVYDDR